MSDGCCDCSTAFDGRSVTYRRVLGVVIALNAAMFVVELAAGYLARSQALQADALDFLGDALTYGLTLLVIGRPLTWRARAALVKGLSIGALALWVRGIDVVARRPRRCAGAPDDGRHRPPCALRQHKRSNFALPLPRGRAMRMCVAAMTRWQRRGRCCGGRSLGYRQVLAGPRRRPGDVGAVPAFLDPHRPAGVG